VLRPQLAIALRQGDLRRIINAVDAVLLRRHLGLNSADLTALREARELLFVRRTGRGKRTRVKN